MLSKRFHPGIAHEPLQAVRVGNQDTYLLKNGIKGAGNGIELLDHGSGRSALDGMFDPRDPAHPITLLHSCLAREASLPVCKTVTGDLELSIRQTSYHADTHDSG